MGKKMTKAGMELRRAIRADIDAEPAVEHKKLRSKYTVGEAIIESAMTKTLAEWVALIAVTADDVSSVKKEERKAEEKMLVPTAFPTDRSTSSPIIMPGLEQGVIKFTRKPAKMGEDFIFWVPRVYIKNGLVDPTVEYEVYLKHATK
jgi:hypothetical protein